MTIFPPGIYHGMSFEAYLAQPGINQSTLKKFGKARSPSHFKWEIENPPEEQDYIRIGRFVDTAMFVPCLLPSGFICWPGDRRTKEWKIFKQANANKVILTASEQDRAVGAATKLAKHEDTTRLMSLCDMQVVVIANHPTLGYRMKACIDLLPDVTRCSPDLAACPFDLKTATDASPDGFSRQAHQKGYDIQAQWYGDILEYAGRSTDRFGFIVVENEPPFEVAIHYYPRDAYEIIEARKKTNRWMVEYMACVESGVWPGYGPSWSRIQKLMPDEERETLE